MTQVEIRRARPEDLDAVAGLYVELKRHHRPLQPDNPRYRVPDRRWLEVARQNLANDSVHLFVATTGGEIEGVMKLALVEKPWGTSCEIDTLVVAAGARGRGLGRALVGQAERFAVESGAAGIRVDVLSANPGGRSFYEGLGYAEFAVRFGKPAPDPIKNSSGAGDPRG